MNKRNVIFIVVILLLLSISTIVYFLFIKKKADFASKKTYDPRSEITWNLLKEKSDILKNSDFPNPLKEYLDLLHGKERYEWNSDKEITFQKINAEFPGERGAILYAVYVSYSFYLEELEILEKESAYTNWEKWEKRKDLRGHYFPGQLKDILFPDHPSQKVQELLFYVEDYVQKNPGTFASERLRIFKKKRNDLYANHLIEIRQWEDKSFHKKLIHLIYSRELSVMSDYEKSDFLGRKLQADEADDFWN